MLLAAVILQGMLALSTGSDGTSLAEHVLRTKVGSLTLAVWQAARSSCFSWGQLSPIFVAGERYHPRKAPYGGALMQPT